MARTTTAARPSATRNQAGPSRGRRVAVVVAVLVAVGAVLWLALFAGGGDGEEAGATVEEFLHVHGLEIPAWADGTVYVSTHEGAFRIDDGRWRWVSEVPHDFMGFAAHPTEEGVFFSSGHPAPGSGLQDPIGFMVSTDGGATWQQRALEGEVDFHAMAVHPDDGDVVYGYDARQGLMRTLDQGHDWETLDAGRLQELGGALSLDVGPGDADEVWAATEVGLVRSTDAGASWEPLVTAPVTAVALDASEPDRVLAYVAAQGQGVVLSEDGGQSWEPLGLELEDDAVGHLAVDPSNPDIMFAGSFGESLWRTTDGGTQWEQLAEEGTPTR